MLYYNAGYLLLPDTGYEEPSYIGLAYSESLLGPYQKYPKPVISPKFSNKWRNPGAGVMKVCKFDYIFAGFNSGIYWGEDYIAITQFTYCFRVTRSAGLTHLRTPLSHRQELGGRKAMSIS